MKALNLKIYNPLIKKEYKDNSIKYGTEENRKITFDDCPYLEKPPKNAEAVEKIELGTGCEGVVYTRGVIENNKIITADSIARKTSHWNSGAQKILKREKFQEKINDKEYVNEKFEDSNKFKKTIDKIDKDCAPGISQRVVASVLYSISGDGGVRKSLMPMVQGGRVDVDKISAQQMKTVFKDLEILFLHGIHPKKEEIAEQNILQLDNGQPVFIDTVCWDNTYNFDEIQKNSMGFYEKNSISEENWGKFKDVMGRICLVLGVSSKHIKSEFIEAENKYVCKLNWDKIVSEMKGEPGLSVIGKIFSDSE